ncbi:DUF2690 domain-containing protein [Kitasatospora sp. NPDC097643]|uniref:DUF2690 domain-containing protein n=1 Tax=Kitasatospora sp. NPDC097643 TaxID=3157230 RepID=UPI00332AFC1B
MGSAWKNLPEELSEPARSLAEELRAIKDAAGLSLSELATRTHYSRASWERWLNGKRVITEQALDALIGAVDCDGPALRTLWEQAVAAPAPGTDGESPETPAADPTEDATRAEAEEPVDAGAVEETIEAGADEAPGGEPERTVPWWRRHPAALLTGAAVLATLLVLVGVRATRDHAQPAAVADPVPTATVPTATPAKPAPAAPTCQAVGCAHKDPKATGCGKDARTLQTDVVAKVVVYLRYSQKCQAAWAAITEGQPNDFATISDSAGNTETAMIHWGYDNYSMMLNAADPAVSFQVCGTQPAGHACTTSVSDLAGVVASTPIPIGPASPPPGAGATATDSPSAAPSAAPSAVPSATVPVTSSGSPSATPSATP